MLFRGAGDKAMAARELNIGVDIGGTNIKFGIVDGEDKIISPKSPAGQLIGAAVLHREVATIVPS